MASSGENELKKTESVISSSIQSKPDRRLSISSKRPENADQRNFRSQYYEKVGFRGVDERKTLELLLSEDPINLIKLKNFALQFSVPSFDRILVWKFMLGKICQIINKFIFAIKKYGNSALMIIGSNF